MTKATYIKTSENNTAVCRVSAWLEAVGIINSRSKVDGHDITALDASGKEREIVVSMTQDPTLPSPDAIVILASEINHRTIANAFKAFANLTQKLGYGRRCPVYRGKQPEQRVNSQEDLESVLFRHMTFRRSPNPPANKWKMYSPVIDSIVKKFFYTNEQLCQDNLLAIEDLTTYAQVWMCNFCGSFEPGNTQHDEHLRTFTAYLKQQFSEFRTKLRQRNVDAESASIALTGKPQMDLIVKTNEDGTRHSLEIVAPVKEETDQERWVRESKEDSEARGRGAVLRKQRQMKAVDDALNVMPHDKRLATIEGIINNPASGTDTIKLAKKWLETHREACSECSAQDESITAIDSAG